MISFKKFREQLYEMVVIGKRHHEGDFVIAFNKYIFILDEINDTEITKIINKINELRPAYHLEIKDFLNLDISDLLNTFKSHITDVFIGMIENDTLVIFDNHQDINRSILIDKIAKELKLKDFKEYNYISKNYKIIERDKEVNQLPKIGYHGTSSVYLNDIIKKGLYRNESKLNWNITSKEDMNNKVFFTSVLEQAKFHAERTARSTKGIPIIIEFNIPDENKIIHDFDSEHFVGITNLYSEPHRNMNAALSTKAIQLSKTLGIFAYNGRVLPNHIRNIWIKNSNIGVNYELYSKEEALKRINK